MGAPLRKSRHVSRWNGRRPVPIASMAKARPASLDEDARMQRDGPAVHLHEPLPGGRRPDPCPPRGSLSRAIRSLSQGPPFRCCDSEPEPCDPAAAAGNRIANHPATGIADRSGPRPGMRECSPSLSARRRQPDPPAIRGGRAAFAALTLQRHHAPPRIVITNKVGRTRWETRGASQFFDIRVFRLRFQERARRTRTGRTGRRRAA